MYIKIKIVVPNEQKYVDVLLLDSKALQVQLKPRYVPTSPNGVTIH
jgi:hypothetical protein